MSIKVELVSGRGGTVWPRPGRVFAAARRHTFEQLATAIDEALARWDPAHPHLFHLPDGAVVVSPGDDDPPGGAEFSDQVKLSRLALGHQFAYTFDHGDEWTHLCTVGEQLIDPYELIGIQPPRPLAYWGWGSIPDQYGRVSADTDEGESAPGSDPGLSDLPPILPWWRPGPSA